MRRLKLWLIGLNLIPNSHYHRYLEAEYETWKRTGKGPIPHLLKQQVVLDYAKRAKADIFVETGTYYGLMLQIGVENFRKAYSIELEPHLYRRAVKAFRRHSNACVLHGDSAQILPQIISEVSAPCLFWLDAHYSGGLTAKAQEETPIRKELQAIFAHPHRHVILIDDAADFERSGDYPEIAWVEKAAKRHGYSFSLDTNIIRLVGQRPLLKSLNVGDRR